MWPSNIRWHHWRVIFVSEDGLAPDWCQAITQTNADTLSIGLSGTNFSEILIKVQNRFQCVKKVDLHIRLTPFSSVARQSNSLQREITLFSSGTGTSSRQPLSFLKSWILVKNLSNKRRNSSTRTWEKNSSDIFSRSIVKDIWTN